MVCTYIRKHFDIDEANTLDKASSLKEDQFGYLAVHFVVQIRDGVKEMEGVSVPDGVSVGNGGFKAEIQVKTLLEHAWAMPLHDRLYKAAIQTPATIKRDAAGLMAIVEAADARIAHLAEQVDSFLGCYAAYLKPAKLEDEIAITAAALDAVTALKSDNAHDNASETDAAMAPLHLHLGRLLALAGKDDHALSEWEKGRAVASASQDMLDMEYGSMLCRQQRDQPKHARYVLGMKLLRDVADRNLDEREVDTRVRRITRAEAAHRLAWAYGNQRGQEYEARNWYRRALALDQDNPYYLADYLAYEVFCTRNKESVLVMRNYVKEAIAACQQHVRVGIEQPRAQFTMGRLHLLLDNGPEALDAYLKAIAILMEPNSYARLDMLKDEIDFLYSINLGAALPPKCDEVDRLLKLAQAAKQLQKGEAFDLTAAMSNEASSGALGHPKRALIIVGGAGSLSAEEIAEFQPIIEWALKYADDLVGSGGTKVGIPGIVGETAKLLAAKGSKGFTLLGYVPKRLPVEAPPDRQNYDILITTTGDDFGVLEPIQGWLDILGLGLKPQQVRVLGMGGGRVAAVEYRLALALGAKVAVIPDSGREADALLRDPDWAANPNLLKLDNSVVDEATVRAFVRPAAFVIESAKLDELASLVHEHYLRGTPYSDVDPVRQSYANLRDDLKASNREQILYAAEILASQGYVLEYVGDPDKIVQPALDPARVKCMAELEHGRFNIERLASGWRPGKRKDAVAKVNPYLQPWQKLPAEIQQYDFVAIGDYASHLQKAGYQIVDTWRQARQGLKPLTLSVKALVRDEQGRCLVIQRSLTSKNNAGQWDFPGGKVDAR